MPPTTPPATRGRPARQADGGPEQQAEQVGLRGERQRPPRGDGELGGDDRGAGCGQGQEVLDGVLTELATEGPDHDDAEEDGPADGDDLGEQREVGGPVGGAAGELGLGADQAEERARRTSWRMNMVRPPNPAAMVNAAAVIHGSRERRAFSSSAHMAAVAVLMCG